MRGRLCDGVCVETSSLRIRLLELEAFEEEQRGYPSIERRWADNPSEGTSSVFFFLLRFVDPPFMFAGYSCIVELPSKLMSNHRLAADSVSSMSASGIRGQQTNLDTSTTAHERKHPWKR